MDQKGSVAMLISIQSAGVAPEVNLRNPLCRRGSTEARESTLALKPRADVTRSPKIGVPVAPRKGLMSSKKNFKKKKDFFSLTDGNDLIFCRSV